MAEQFPVINVAAGVDTFGVVFSRLNSLILYTNTDCVSVNSGGGLTSGLGFVNGTFGSNTLVCSTIQGGNVTIPSPLALVSNLNLTGNLINISTNTVFQGGIFQGNSTASLFLNSISVTVRNSISNSVLFPTSLTIGGNAVLNTGSFFLGNSIANLVLNSTSATLANGTSQVVVSPTSVLVGSNVIINTTTIAIGSLTINSTYGAGSLIPTANLVYSVGNAQFRWELYAGNGDFSNAVTMANNLSVAGNTTHAANVTVSGSTLLGNLVVQQNANVNQGLTAQGNSTIYAINATGNTILNGNLSVTGSASILGNFNVAGNLTYTATSYGNIVPSSNLTSALGNTGLRWQLYAGNGDFSNAVTIANTLFVAGATTMNTLSVTGEIIGNLTSNVITVISTFGLGTVPDLQQRMLSTATAGTSAQVLDTYIAANFRTAKYLIQVMDLAANNYYATEILVMHDGTNVLVTEYAELVTNSIMGTFNANISAGVVQLFFTPASTSTTVKLFRTMITV
jgi:hypothetical protein